MLQLAEEDCQCLSHMYAKMGPYEGDFYNPTLARLSCFFLFFLFCLFQSKAVLVLLSLGKFYKALDMLYR